MQDLLLGYPQLYLGKHACSGEVVNQSYNTRHSKHPCNGRFDGASKREHCAKSDKCANALEHKGFSYVIHAHVQLVFAVEDIYNQ